MMKTALGVKREHVLALGFDTQPPYSKATTPSIPPATVSRHCDSFTLKISREEKP